jgi:hypothetical protein
MADPDVDAALDELYAAPLDEFTSTRNALAKQVGGAAGTRIKALKKPNIAAWGLNQLARTHGDELDAFFTTTDKLRHAQRRAMSGGKASDLRAATDERNRAAGRLTKLVEKILADAGHAAAASTLSAARDSFVAAGSDELGAELLRKGRLTRELQPGAVVDVGGLTLVPDAEPGVPDEPDPGRSQLKAARESRDEARAALKAARDALKKANTEATRLEIEADEASKIAKRAQEKADFSRRAADARRDDVEGAEKAVEEAEKAVEAAEN